MALTKEKIDLIEAKAHDLLQSSFEVGTLSLPINLGKIAQKNSISLKKAEFIDADALGSLERHERTIYVADGLSFPRTAFTIAHELGHFFLHEDKQQDTFWRTEMLNLDKQNKDEEQEANWFAASLLMPKTEILKRWSNTHDMAKLATIFGVSQTAMWYRLKNLGLLADE